MQTPAFKFLGHYMAHPTYHEGVHNDILSKAQVGLARFGHLPLNSFETAQLLRSILIPQGVCHCLLVPDDRFFYRLDRISRSLVTSTKGMEKIHNVTHLISPKSAGGLGLQQDFWPFRARYITIRHAPNTRFH